MMEFQRTEPSAEVHVLLKKEHTLKRGSRKSQVDDDPVLVDVIRVQHLGCSSCFGVEGELWQ